MFRFPQLIGRRAGSALAAAALLAGGAGLSALAPSAHAGVTTPTVHCVLPAGQGEGSGPQQMDITLTPASAAPGTVVHAVVALGPGPVNSTQTLNDVQTTPSVELAMSGGATGNVTVTGPTFLIDTVNGQPVTLPVFEGDFIIPNTAQGVVDFTPVRTLTQTVVPPFGTFSTPCDVTSGATSIGSVNVQGPGSEQPSLTSPAGQVRPGQPLTFSGLGWPASATPSVTVCPAAGGTCVLNPVSESTLSISALGQLTGTAKLAISGIPNGDYTVTVSAGTKQATSTISVEAFVPTGARVMTMNPSSGPLGTVVTLTGSNWNPNVGLTISQLDANNAVTGTTIQIGTSYDGTFTTTFTIDSPALTQVRAREGISSIRAVSLPYTLTVEPAAAVATPGRVFKSGTTTLSGGYWPAGSTATAQLCNADGSGCAASRLATQTLGIDATGNLAGSVKVASGVGYGTYLLKVSTPSGVTATAPLIVQRTIKVTNTVGHAFTVEGWDFGDFETVYVDALDANGNVVASLPTFTLFTGYWSTTFILESNAVTIRATDTSSTPKTSVYRFR